MKKVRGSNGRKSGICCLLFIQYSVSHTNQCQFTAIRCSRIKQLYIIIIETFRLQFYRSTVLYLISEIYLQ